MASEVYLRDTEPTSHLVIIEKVQGLWQAVLPDRRRLISKFTNFLRSDLADWIYDGQILVTHDARIYGVIEEYLSNILVTRTM